MKNLILIGAFILTGFAAQAQANKTQAMATADVIAVNKVEHDFGVIPQGTPVTTEFVVTNKSKTPLIITEVKTSCGCTTPDYTKTPIAPGKTGIVKASYNAAAMGDFNKSVTLITNQGEKMVFIKGSVSAKTQ
jgi:hypothetical protein